MIKLSEKPSKNFLISLALIIIAIASSLLLNDLYFRFDSFPDISEPIFIILILCSLFFYLVACYKYALRKNHWGLLGIIVGIFVLFVSLPVLGKTYSVIQKRMQEAYIKSHYPVIISKNEQIEKSGYTKEEVDEIIRELMIQKGVEEKKVLSIKKLSDTEAEIETGEILGPLNGSGRNYKAEKINGKWIIKNGSFWIS